MPYIKPSSDTDSPWLNAYDAMVFRFVVGDYMGEIAFRLRYISEYGAEPPLFAIRYFSSNWSQWKTV